MPRPRETAGHISDLDEAGVRSFSAELLDVLDPLARHAAAGDEWGLGSDHPLYQAMSAGDTSDDTETPAAFPWHMPEAAVPQPTIAGPFGWPDLPRHGTAPVIDRPSDPMFVALDATAAAGGWTVRVSQIEIDGDPGAITDGRTYGLDVEGRVVALAIATELSHDGSWAPLDILLERPSVWEVVTLSTFGWRTFTLPTVTAGAAALADPAGLLAALDAHDRRDTAA